MVRPRPSKFPDWDLNHVNAAMPANNQIANGRPFGDLSTSTEQNFQFGYQGQWIRNLNNPCTTNFSASPATVTLTNLSTRTQVFTGSGNQTVMLPAETSLQVGESFTLVNAGTGTITVQDSIGGALSVLQAPVLIVVAQEFFSTSAATPAGNWAYTRSPGQMPGVHKTISTSIDDNAVFGNTGEAQSTTVSASTASSNVVVTLGSLGLFKGDWDVFVKCDYRLLQNNATARTPQMQIHTAPGIVNGATDGTWTSTVIPANSGALTFTLPSMLYTRVNTPSVVAVYASAVSNIDAGNGVQFTAWMSARRRH